MNEQFPWYVSRGSGIVAAALLALTLIWGLLLSTRLIERRGLPAWLTDLHRYLGGLTVAFIGIHMAALFFDGYASFSLKELFVPFASPNRQGYESWPVAYGVGALWALLVVEGTSVVMRKMPRKVWRRFHYLSYPVAVLVGLHAVTAGTDMSSTTLQLVGLGLAGVLTFLTIYRMLGGREKTPRNIPRPSPSGAARPEAVPAATPVATVPVTEPSAPPQAVAAASEPPSTVR
ncbi:MAG: ferric reductase-like transmembrane domain-containing protein [Actinomycetes bacterium]